MVTTNDYLVFPEWWLWCGVTFVTFVNFNNASAFGNDKFLWVEFVDLSRILHHDVTLSKQYGESEPYEVPQCAPMHSGKSLSRKR